MNLFAISGGRHYHGGSGSGTLPEFLLAAFLIVVIIFVAVLIFWPFKTIPRDPTDCRRCDGTGWIRYGRRGRSKRQCDKCIGTGKRTSI